VVKSTSENAPPNSRAQNRGEKKLNILKHRSGKHRSGAKRSGKSVSLRKSAPVRRAKPSPQAGAPAANAVFLVGFMGAGKSSVGRLLGQRLNWVFEDLDDRITGREGRAVAEIFRDAGESEFRQAEHAALQHVLKEVRRGGARIIALGGGAFVQKENAALLKAAGVPTVFLDAPVDELWQRCCTQALESGKERPLLNGQPQFRKLYETRRTSYSNASLKIQTGSRTVETIADEIAERLGLKKIAVRTEQGEVE
jgi:shikimate kinase